MQRAICSSGRRRVLGELLDSRCRVVYTTDLQHTVSGSFDNLSGLADFFWQKLEANPEDPLNSLMVGARFTYSADTFDALPSARHGEDPVESCKLHCLWPSFPFGAFGDDSNFSELDARVAPFWKLRVLRKDSTSLPLTGRLRSLLNFRKEALTVRSAEHSLQPAVPKTAMASLTATIQESLESILLPTAGEMLEMVESCMSYPIYPAFQENPGASDPLRAVQGARPGDRLSRLAELSSSMRCFKGSVMLWCGILARMRSQWDALEAPLSPEAPTHRVNARGTRTEFFDRSVCLVQQKMELLERSIVEQQRYLRGASQPEAFYLAANGEQRRAPELLPPPLLTEDVKSGPRPKTGVFLYHIFVSIYHIMVSGSTIFDEISCYVVPILPLFFDGSLKRTCSYSGTRPLPAWILWSGPSSVARRCAATWRPSRRPKLW